MTTNRLLAKGGLIIVVTVGLLASGGAVALAQYGRAFGLTSDATSGMGTFRPGQDAILQRATKIIGEPLKNTQGETLGTVEDLVLTPDLEGISYAVLTTGGVFGLGNELHAIPWSAMQAGIGDTIVAPIDKRELEQDRGFRADLWPSEGDPRWLSPAGERVEQVRYDVQTAAEGEDVRLRRASRIMGMRAKEPYGDTVGTVRDLVIDLNSGRIPFTIVAYGGLLGFGRKYTAVPADSIEFQPPQRVARVQVEEQILRANAFDPGSFPDLSDPVYAQRLYAAYDVQAAAPDWTVLGYVPPEEPAVAPTPGPAETPPRVETPAVEAAEPAGIEREYLAAFDPANMTTINGTVTEVSRFFLVDDDGAEWLRLQVRSDLGQVFTVQLGPRDYISRQDFYAAAGDRITLSGSQTTAWGRPVILPVTVTVSGRSLNLRDPDGRPLWEQSVESPPAAEQAQQ